MATENLLTHTLILLSAPVIAVPLAKRLGLGSVLGYLGAGMIIGPSALALIHDPEHILHIAELGVVMLLFLIGLELNPHRLWSMRRRILGLGGGQIGATAITLMLLILLPLGLSWQVALVLALGLSLSSTAMALQLLTEKNLLPTPGGQAGFAVLLSQDIAVIPMLALLPLLGATPAGGGWIDGAKAIAAVAAIVISGHYLLPPIFRWIAGTRLREVFTASALLLVLGIAALMQSVGLSMALGSFLAGVLLAESEYRHALESDLLPFKGLLLGLFFLAVGMSVDFALLIQQPLLILAAVFALVSIKMLILLLLAHLHNLPVKQLPLFALLLSQGGEFAFVLFSVAGQGGILPSELHQLAVVVVALSMLTTPLLLLLHERLLEPRLTGEVSRSDETIDEHNPVIIAGFGRFGQIVARLLHANGIGTTLLDHDPAHIELVRRFGFKVFYGDSARLELLHAAGAEQAKLLVLAIDDRERSVQVAEMAKREFPHLSVIARAWDVPHYFDLLDKKVDYAERETFEGALRLAVVALQRFGFTPERAQRAANLFREHDERTLIERLYPIHREDLSKRIEVATEARHELEALFEEDERVNRAKESSRQE